MPLPSWMTETQIGDDYPGTAATIAAMHALTAAGAADDRVIRLARQIAGAAPPKNYAAECQAILSWCQGNLRYVRDPSVPKGLERLQHPVVTIFETRGGDCDELAPAFSALCAAIGNPWGFRTVGSDPLFPKRFKHVYSLVGLAGGWVPADPSERAYALGEEPPPDDPRFQFTQDRGALVTTKQDWFPT